MQVLRFAQEIDRSGQQFYEEMAGRAANPGVSNIFRRLARDEERLLARLEAHAAKAGSCDSPALDRGTNIFEQLRRQEDWLSVPDDVAAYRLAVDAEREVLQQYRMAVATEENPALRKMLAEIAEDEQHLLEELEQLHDFASEPNRYLAWGEFSNLGEFRNFGRNLA